METNQIKSNLTSNEEGIPKKYRLGIALSGGGIKGLCHAGVLKALEEEGIKPDVISGVSAGAIVGALYADVCSPDDIVKLFETVEFRKMTKLRVPNEGFFTTEPFDRFLGSVMKARVFADLKLPLRVVATNLEQNESVVFSEGNLLQAVMASANFPILFSPRLINGEHYVDGGVLKNFPVSTIRDDCDIIIGVNASPLVPEKYKKSILSVALCTYNLMFKANSIPDKALCDYLIEPVDVGNYETFEIDKSREIFELGYNTAKELIKDWRLNKKLDS